VPVHYNPAAPRQAAYAGPGGDLQYTRLIPPGPAYFGAAAWFSLAAAFLLTGISRLIGIMRAADAVPAPVRLSTSRKTIHTDQLIDRYGLEWLRLDNQPDPSGDVFVFGEPVPGRWLTVLLDDGQLIWPATKAQPTLASTSLRLPIAQPDRLEAVHLLLAGYAQIVGLLDRLPTVIHKPLGADADWWILGALRPIVKTLVSLHLRRHLAALNSALLQATLLPYDMPDTQSRRALAEAGNQCRTFAGTLPRRGLLAVLATIAATSLSIVSPFVFLPHIHVSGQTVAQYLSLVLAVVLIFGIVPLVVFFHSVRCKRSLFTPASGGSNRRVARSTASVSTEWNIYELERTAFTAFGIPHPREWESTPLIGWLVGIIYGGAILSRAKIEILLPFLALLGIVAASVAIVKIYRWQRRIHTLQASPDWTTTAEDATPSVP
jgi:hypothetical protein